LEQDVLSLLDFVPEEHNKIKGNRLVIAPYNLLVAILIFRHAGYVYSGESAAYAYRSLDFESHPM
jgi:AmmeMemoRadiSam system protein B